MSEAPLPENMADWPEDPSDLLGVPPRAGLRAVRRAYSRLVRFYKPEHRPTEFRRIRDAYEALEPMARFWDEYSDADSTASEAAASDGNSECNGAPTTTDATAQSAATGRPEQPDGRMHRPERVAVSSVANDPDALWKEALAAEDSWERIYRDLTAIVRRGDRDELAFCRLYWLLQLTPELEPERRAVDWLADGIHLAGERGRLLALYFDELRRHPEEAREERSAGLLQHNLPHFELAEIARHRWRALHRCKRPELIEGDLQALRQPLFFHRETWLRLLLWAADVLSWSESDAAFGTLVNCRDEIAAATDLHLALSQDLDRLELLNDLFADYDRCARLRSVDPPGALFHLVPDLWLLPVDELRPQIIRALESWVTCPPRVALDQFANFCYVGNVVLNYLMGVLRSLDSSGTSESDGAQLIERRVAVLIESYDWQFYGVFRETLAEFCIESNLTIEDVLGVILGRPEYAYFAAGAPLKEIRDDRPLQCLLLAHRAFCSGIPV